MSPQSGLPHNNRVGDFDPFALPVLMRATGKGLEELLDDLASRSGLLGLSGLSGDLRDLEQAADRRSRRSPSLALEHFVTGDPGLPGVADGGAGRSRRGRVHRWDRRKQRPHPRRGLSQ